MNGLVKKYFFFFLFCYFSVCSCRWDKEKSYPDDLHPVRIARVHELNVVSRVYTGVVEAEEYADLAFKTAGPLVEMKVEAGERVKKGMLIAAVDPLDYQARYDAAQAAYVTARSQLERNERLLAVQAVSRQEYEMGRANFVKTQSAYLTARNTLNDTKLRAPFDGFIERKYVENYQKIQAGEPVVRLVNPDRLAICFTLPETSAGMTRDSLKIRVEFDTYKGHWFRARISEIVDASPEGGGIPVKVVVDDSVFTAKEFTVYPGFSARVRLETANRIPHTYVVPLSAVFEDIGSSLISVWRFHSADSVVERLSVTAEQLSGSDGVMIRQGLREEDRIVVEGTDFLTEGQQVRVLPWYLPVP